MTPERWRQLSTVFHGALERDAATRARFVDEACAADPDLRDEVLALLKAHHDAGRFGQDPIPALPSPGLMRLEPGTSLGPYRIESALGAGGMGEVYKATDARLDRTVALKVLPEHVASDAESRQRFEREAKTVASLSHPHICPLFDVGEQDGVHFLVMEYLEGETLAERLKSGALPLPEALRYATQIADALDRAHRRGIVHRDLKPANIMLTATGAKLLDFGLAKLARSHQAVGVGFSAATTTDEPLTGRGTLVGTLPYMAPEQVQGKDADARTDIFAFGAVLYELVTGVRAFDADSHADLIGAILKDDVPPIAARQPMTPAALDRVIRRCLAKDPDERWQSAGDLRYEIHRIATEPLQETSSRVAPGRTEDRGRRERLWWAAALAAAIGGTWFAVATVRDGGRAAGGQAIKFSVTLPAGLRLMSSATSVPMAVSPSGERIVFSAVDANGSAQLYVRELDEPEIRALPGSEGGLAPFFSHDGRWVGFAASGALKKVPIAGGPAVMIAEKAVDVQFGGASWGTDDTIVFASTRVAGLSRIPATGGIPKAITTPDADKGEVSHFLPQYLPGGRAVLFTTRAGLNAAPSRIEVVVLDTGERRVIAESGINARYVPTGHIVFGGDGLLSGSLWALPFDSRTLRATGREVRVGDSLLAPAGLAHFTLAGSGTLVFAPREGRAPEELVWVDMARETSVLAETPGNFSFPRISPDGKRVAVTILQGGDKRSGVWIFDLDRPNAPVLFSSQSRNDHLPVWTPDGTRLLFTSLWDAAANREGAANLYWKRPNDSGAPERLTTSPHHQDPASWSPDGNLLTFADQHPTTRWDVWLLDMRDRTTRPLIKTSAQERHPMISPDGKWLAYASNETGQEEVYVQPFPGGGEKHRVSNAGGNQPLWARDGRRLFYRRANEVVSVTVTPGPELAIGKSEILAEGAFDGAAGNGAPNYDVSADGRRLLMVRLNELPPGTETHLDVVVNWFAELAARVRTK